MTPFEYGMRHEYRLTDTDLKNVQYYTSARIVMQRELLEEDISGVTEGHTIRRVQGRLIEEIIIPKGTPCIALDMADSSIAAAFEPNESE